MEREWKGITQCFGTFLLVMSPINQINVGQKPVQPVVAQGMILPPVRDKLPHVKETNNVNIWSIIKPLIGKDLTKVAIGVLGLRILSILSNTF